MGAKKSCDPRTPARRRWLTSVVRWVARRSSIGLGLALLVAGSLLTLPAESVSAQAAHDYAVGAVGTDGALWVETPPLAGWHSLGGRIIASPALAAVPESGELASPLFIATATDHSLWIRSLSQNWTSLTPGLFTYCLDSPAAAVTEPATAPVLTVACEGADHALYAATVAVPSSGLPTVTGWTDLGGALGFGPAVAPVNGVITYFVTAGVNRGQVGSEIWTRTDVTGWRPMPSYVALEPAQAYCIGPPAAAIALGGTTTWFGCHGLDGQLWAGGGVGFPFSLHPEGGALIGGPGVAVDSGGTSFLAEGTDHSVWIEDAGTGSWRTLGGQVVGGIGAVGLN